MKKSLIIPIAAAVVLAGLTSFYFWQQAEMARQSFAAQSQELENQKQQLSQFQQLKRADSLLFAGNFKAAKRQYDQMEGDSLLSDRALSNRLRHTRHFLNMQFTLDTLRADTGDRVIPVFTAIKTPEPEPVKALPFEERQPDQFDSLSFALQKADMHISLLEKQLQHKAKSTSYLSFKSSKGNRVYYIGDIKKNKANGQGVALLSTGSRYEGQWLNNKKHGEGTFYWSDGAYYEGEYHKDKRTGQGTYHFPNGEVFVGDWKNDVRHGSGIIYDKDGNIVAKGRWKNDEFVEG